MAKQIAKATGAENYNVLQNNGRLAHQEVDHVSVIPIVGARGGRRLVGVVVRLCGLDDVDVEKLRNLEEVEPKACNGRLYRQWTRSELKELGGRSKSLRWKYIRREGKPRVKGDDERHGVLVWTNANVYP